MDMRLGQKPLIGGKYRIAEGCGDLGIGFPAARRKYGDRMITNAQADRILADFRIWDSIKNALLIEACPFHTRTFVALSEAPLGDSQKDGEKIFVFNNDKTVRFGGFSEADLRHANIRLDQPGTLLVIDQKYEVADEGRGSYSVIIKPEQMAHVDAFYNVEYSASWREVEPKHMLPIGRRTSPADPYSRLFAPIGEVGHVVHCGDDFCGRSVFVGGRFDMPHRVLVEETS